jgi:hypothetical protein
VRRFSDPVEVRVHGDEVERGRALTSRAVRGRIPGVLHQGAGPQAGPQAGPRLAAQGYSLTGLEPGDCVEGGVGDPGQPEAFIWRDRLYVVREVLVTWRERRAWWREALDADDAQVRPGETLAVAARERQVWRVEASPGWSFTPGVYDLAFDEAEPRPVRVASGAGSGGTSSGGWSLIRVAD